MDENVIFRSDPAILSTVLTEKRLRFTLKWKRWKLRTVTIQQNGMLKYKTEYNLFFFCHRITHGELDIRKAMISYIPEEILLATLTNENLHNFTGLTIKCKTVDGFETYFRCVLEVEQFERLMKAIKIASPRNNVEKLGPIPQLTDEQIRLRVEKQKSTTTIGISSVMRRTTTIAQAMNAHDMKSRREQIIAKRGALKDLPVYFLNDLIHGSWWFVIGSVGFVITASIALANSYDFEHLLGEDDSTLSSSDYRATWWLMVVSGIFCTLGSLAFVRALHEDPPMRPMFSWYHLQNDELLGSWLFFFAVLPFIPYSLIYLANAGYTGLLFLGMLVLSIFIAIACLMFAIACYPSDTTTRSNVFMPVMKVLLRCCCCSRRWLQTHLRNDWLAGVWFFYWASLAGTFGCFVMFLYVMASGSALQSFILGTSLFENIAFLLGSAYFVAGSYPEGTMVIDDDFLSVSVEEEMEGMGSMGSIDHLTSRLQDLSPSGHGQSYSLNKLLTSKGNRDQFDVVNPLMAASNEGHV